MRQLDNAAVPFTLGDVPLYVLTSNELYTADAYTGGMETEVSDFTPGALDGLPYTSPDAYNTGTSPDVVYGDLAMRNDGELYAVTAYPQASFPADGINQDQWSGTYVNLNTGNASDAPASTTSNGLITYIPVGGSPTETGDSLQYPVGGIQVNATTFGPGSGPDDQTDPYLLDPRDLYAVGNDALANYGNPADLGIPSTDPANYPFAAAQYGLDNLMYRELGDSAGTSVGTALDPVGITNTDGAREPTNVVPLAQLMSGATIEPPAYGATSAASGVDAIGADNDILDGSQFAITDGSTTANSVTFQFDSGPDMDLGPQGALGVRSGQQFSLTEETSTGPVTKNFEFVSGPVLIFPNDVNGSLNGATFSVTDDKGKTDSFEFIDAPATTPPTAVAPGYTAVTITAGSSAQTGGQRGGGCHQCGRRGAGRLGRVRRRRRKSDSKPESDQPAVNVGTRLADPGQLHRSAYVWERGGRQDEPDFGRGIVPNDRRHARGHDCHPLQGNLR